MNLSCLNFLQLTLDDYSPNYQNLKIDEIALQCAAMFYTGIFRARLRESFPNIFRHRSTVKPGLEITCVKRPPALRDHCSDTTTLLKST